MYAIDCSVWSDFEVVKQEMVGADLVIVGLHHGITPNHYAQQQLAYAVSQGKRIAAYITISPSTNELDVVNQARDLAAEFWPQLSFVSIDVEIEGVGVLQIINACKAVEAMGKRVCIYTNQGFWQEHMDDTQMLSNYPLWDANWNDHQWIEPVGYGGWDWPIGHQYQELTAVDWSVFNDTYVDESSNQSELLQLMDILWGWTTFKKNKKVTRALEKECHQAIIRIKEILEI